MAQGILNAIEKKMSSGGKNTPRLDMNKFIQLADADKIRSDVESEIVRVLNEKFEQQRKPGESFDEWLKRTPKEELIRLELKNGSRVVDIRDYMKPKEPKIKELDLASQFTPGKTLESLTPKEREAVNMLLRLTLGKKK